MSLKVLKHVIEGMPRPRSLHGDQSRRHKGGEKSRPGAKGREGHRDLQQRMAVSLSVEMEEKFVQL